MAYDFAPGTRLAVTYGEWRNDSRISAASYLRNAAGQTVTSGPVLIDGVRYNLTAGNFAPSESETVNRLFGVTFDSPPGRRLAPGECLLDLPDTNRCFAGRQHGHVNRRHGSLQRWHRLEQCRSAPDLEAEWRPGRTSCHGWFSSGCLYL